MSPLRLLVRNMMRTLGGRMLFGPAYYCFFAWKDKVLAVRDRRWRALRPLLWHVPALAAILYWVLVVCEIPFWAYVAFFAYPGTALTLVRSYAEHRAAGPVQQRTVICESNFFWSWLFLYNNLHLIHHRHPRLAWHQRREQVPGGEGAADARARLLPPQRLHRSVRQVVHAPEGADGASDRIARADPAGGLNSSRPDDRLAFPTFEPSRGIERRRVVRE